MPPPRYSSRHGAGGRIACNDGRLDQACADLIRGIGEFGDGYRVARADAEFAVQPIDGGLPDGSRAGRGRMARRIRSGGQCLLRDAWRRIDRCADRKVDDATEIGTSGLLRVGNRVLMKLRDARRDSRQVMAEFGEEAPR